jgi:hypothetical protein
MVNDLPSMCEAWSIIPSTEKEKKKKRNPLYTTKILGK